MANITLLPSAKVPLIYPDTNGMTTEWYRFFWNVYGFTGDPTGTIPVNKGGTGLDTIGDHQVIIGNANNVFEPAVFVGSGISITYAPGIINLAIGASGVTPGTYGSASQVGVFTVNQFGNITAATNTSIGIDASQIISGTIASARISGSYTGITGVGTLTVGTWNATTIGAAYGGTGQSTYTIGDLLYATGTTSLSKLAIGASTYILTSSSTAPQWTIPSSVTVGTATNLAGGAANRIAYQTSAGATSFIVAPTVSNTYLEWSGSAFQWSSNPLGTVTSVSVVSANGFAGTVATATTTPAITLTTTITGLLKGNGTAISAATSGTDYAPATSGTSILYGNGSGGFSNVTIGTGVSFVAGTLSATGSGGTVTSVAALTLGTSGTDLTSTVANGTTTPVITLQVPTASATNRGALSAADWTTFNNKASAFTYTSNYIPYGQGTTTPTQSAGLQFNGTTFTTTGISTSNNLAFTGSGNRITGDFTSAGTTNAVIFQSSTVNGATALQAIPNGTSVQTNLILYNGTDFANYSRANIRHNATSFTLTNQVAGSGVYVPFIIETSGAEKFRIAADTTGTYTFGGTAPRIIGDFSGATIANRIAFQTSTVNANTALLVIPNGTGTTAQYQASNNSDPTNSSLAQFAVLSTDVRILSNILGTGTYLPITFFTGGSESLRLSATAKTLILAGGLTSSNGTGVTFPATQSASSDANTLDDYEEGTWTPADASGAGLSFTSVTARYTKIGNVVNINAILTYPTTADASQAKISGLPFAPAVSGILTFVNPGVPATGAGFGWIAASSTTATLVAQNNTAKSNANLSTLQLYFTGMYTV